MSCLAFLQWVNASPNLVLGFARSLTGLSKRHIWESAQSELAAFAADCYAQEPRSSPAGCNLQKKARDSAHGKGDVAAGTGVLQSLDF